MNYLFCDLETTGLEETQHAIVQIAAIATDEAFNVRGYFMSYIKPWPGAEITDEALAINGLTREFIDKAPSEDVVAMALATFIGCYGEPTFAGFNCPFDLKFLAAMSERTGIALGYAVPWLCVYTRAKKHLRLDSYKLTSVAEHLGIPVDGAHDATADLLMTIRIARKLCLREAVTTV